ncbi:hypothetical protein PTKIN_Ptkin16aG0026600 [Pterospermum kingtungense]
MESKDMVDSGMMAHNKIMEFDRTSDGGRVVVPHDDGDVSQQFLSAGRPAKSHDDPKLELLRGTLMICFPLKIKKGCVPHPDWLLQGFRSVVFDCELHDLPLQGYPYTWSRSKGSADVVNERID